MIKILRGKDEVKKRDWKELNKVEYILGKLDRIYHKEKEIGNGKEEKLVSYIHLENINKRSRVLFPHSSCWALDGSSLMVGTMSY